MSRHFVLAILALVGSLLFAATPAFAARTIDSATLNGGTSVTVAPGATISVTITVTTSGFLGLDTNWNCTRWRIGSGAWTNVDHGNHSGSGTYSETFGITAPSNLGTYSVSFIAHSNNNCTSGDSNTYTLTNAIMTVPRSCVSAANGNWSAANTWNCGSGPGDGPPAQYDSVTINSHTVTLNTSPTIASFTNNSGTLSQSGTRTLTVAGNFTNQSNATVNASNLTLNVGGNTVFNGSATVSALNASGDVTVNTNPNNPILTLATLTVAGNATFNGRLTATTFNSSGNVTSNSSAALNVTNLVFQKSGTQAATFYGNNNNVTNLTINAGTTVSSTDYSLLNLKGNLINNGTLNLPNTTWTLNGTTAQSIGGSSDSTLGHLTVDNTAGLTLNRNVIVPGNLTLTRGIVTTGSYVLSSTKFCPGAISGGSATSYVNGNLRLSYPGSGVTCTYPVGSNGAYIPMTVTIPWFSGISGGTLTGSTAAGEHPQVASSGIDKDHDVNRYWTLGAGGDTMATLPVGGSYTVTLPFLSSEVDAGSTVSGFKAAVYTATGWSTPLAGSTTGTTTTYPGGRFFGSYAVGAAAPPFCSPPPNAPSDIALSCVCDLFDRGSLNPSPIYGANWLLSNSDGTGANPSIVNQNYLRLTPKLGNQAKAATVPGVFPAAGNYISVEFKHYAYDGSGADGIAVTLSDYAVPVVPGAFGGSLGYAPKNSSSDCTTPGGCPGFAGGWIGVALDEFGNYQNPTEGRTGGPGARADSVGIRGPGSGLNGYRWMGGTAAGLDIDAASSTTPAPGYMYQIIVDARDVLTGTARVFVNRDTTTKDGSSYVNLFGGAGGFNAYSEAAYAVTQGWTSKLVPDYWKISFTGSTGASNNIHEIGSLRICAQTVYPPDNFGGTAKSFNAIDEAYPFPAGAAQWQNYQTGHIYTKLAGVAFKLNVAALADSGIKEDYVATGTKNVTVKLVDNSDNVCVTDSTKANYCNADCKSKPAIAGGTQTLAFAPGDKGQKKTSDFTIPRAYSRLAVLVEDSTVKACATDEFAVRPTGATVTASTATQTGSSGDPKFKAGEDTFSVTVEVDKGSYNGKLKIGNPLPVAPATVAGDFGAATPEFPSATPGVSTSTVTGAFTYSEVGVFRLPGYIPATDATSPRGIWDDTWTAVDSPSTQGDCVIGSYSNAKDANGKYGCLFGLTADKSFGRFIPHHFAIVNATLTNRPAACDASAVPPFPASSFSYLDEPIGLSFSLEARAAGGTVTQNYAGTLAKLVLSPSATAIENLKLGAASTTPALVLTPRLSTSGFAGNWSAGTAALAGTITVSSLDAPLPNNRVAPDGPFADVRFGIAPVDADGVSLKSGTMDLDADETAGNERKAVGDPTSLRFGLLKLTTAYGSELLDLSVPVEARYWNGTGFIVNSDDNCTIPHLSAANVGATGSGPALEPVVKSLGNGKGRIVIPSPDKTKRNVYRVCLDIGADGTCSATQAPFGYLTGPWDGSDAYDRDPSARAAFGLNRGAYLYHREQY